jgi:hypothetical protein
MNKRPHSITFIGCLSIAAGTAGLVFLSLQDSLGAAAHRDAGFGLPQGIETALLLVIRLLAVVGGAFLLCGRHWARWLLALWMVYHLALSALHSITDFIIHAVSFGAICYLLFRPAASA